jgi:hypothetical protein
MSRRSGCVVFLTLTALPWTALAQQQTPAAPPAAQRPALPPPAARTGNPTPGTPQPEPPNVADRVTVSGCLRLAPGAGAAPASAATTPASNRFILGDAKKDGRVPPDTGTSPAAAAAAAAVYTLEALESQLSPFVDTRVELSGEVKGTADAPLLLVEFVRKIAAKCQ